MRAFPQRYNMSQRAIMQREGRKHSRLLAINLDIQDQSLISNILQTESEPYELLFRDSLGPANEFRLEGGPFDVIVINFSSSTKADFDLLAVIQREDPLARVIFLSRLADESLWIESIQRGAYDFLPKPLDQQEFRRILNNAIQKP